MATLAQIRDTVNRKLQDPNSSARSALVVDDEINRAIRYYQSNLFGFNERLVTLNLVSGAQRITGLPSDIILELQTGGLILIDDQVKISLSKLHPDNFAERDDDQTGRPYYYTYRDQSYDVLPIPDDDYTLQFRYLKKYEPLVNDTDTNDFTEQAQDLIILHVLARVYAEDKQDAQLGAYYEGLRSDELRTLRDRTDPRVGTGYLQSRSILNDHYH